MLSLMLMGGVISRLISGMLSDRLGGVKTLLIGATLQCIGLILYLPSDGLTSLYLVSLIFGLSQGGIVPSYAIIVREYLPARVAGERVGFVMMATIMGMALGGGCQAGFMTSADLIPWHFGMALGGISLTS
jgi:MFS family permease